MGSTIADRLVRVIGVIRHGLHRVLGGLFSFVAGDRTERMYKRKAESRELLTDDEYYERYYHRTDVERDVVVRVRKVVATQLAFTKVVPSDNICQMFLDIPFDEVVWDLAEEFGFQWTHEELSALDGSLNSLIRYVARKTQDTECGLARPKKRPC